jgi:hypothetical protein
MDLRRVGATTCAALALSASGCVLLGLLVLPFELLFSLFGAAGGAVGIAQVDPPGGPAPVAQQIAPEQWVVTGLREDVRCEIVCSAPGFETTTYSWPRDFVNHGGKVDVHLERSR